MWTAQKIRLLRQQGLMKEPSFAESLGVTVSVVRQWELGILHPSAPEEARLTELEQRVRGARVRLADFVNQHEADRMRSPVKSFVLPGGGTVSTDGHGVYISEPKK
jgi:transcriptional regulator with XRE-family HTH domain